MAAGFLQYRFGIQLRTEKLRNPPLPEGVENPDFVFYKGACKMIEAMGGEWKRIYRGGDTPEEMDDIKNYSHVVWLPSDEKCSRLNFDMWD